MSFLDHIAAANRCNPSHFRPLRVDGQRVGFITQVVADVLQDWPTVFRVGAEAIELSPELAAASAQTRTEAIAEVARALHRAGLTASTSRIWVT